MINALGVESLRSTVSTTWPGGDVEPVLYVVAIGVAKYRDSRFDLRYASRDAEDLCDYFKQSHSGFAEARVMPILNEEAVRSRVIQISEFLARARIDDTVIVAFAGHGLLDDDDRYFFATHDMDFDGLCLLKMVFDRQTRRMNRRNRTGGIALYRAGSGADSSPSVLRAIVAS